MRSKLKGLTRFFCSCRPSKKAFYLQLQTFLCVDTKYCYNVVKSVFRLLLLGPHDCEFEAGGMCHWTLCNLNSYPRWHRHTGPTPSSGTGPQNDHTSGSGAHARYIQSWHHSRPQRPQRGRDPSVLVLTRRIADSGDENVMTSPSSHQLNY